MPTPPPLPAGSGNTSSWIRWLYDEVRGLQPQRTPGLLLSRGSRGVARRPFDPIAISKKEFAWATVQEEQDDYLVCTIEGTADVKVAKPIELQASAWNPGWQPGAPVDPLFGNDPFTYGYLSANQRRLVYDHRTVGSPAATANILAGLKLDDAFAGANKPAQLTTIAWWSVRQQVYPHYWIPVIKVDPVVRYSRLRVARLSQDDAFGTADDPIIWLDTNIDGRHWADYRTTLPSSQLIYLGSGISHFFFKAAQVEIFDADGNLLSIPL
jgi:hypothetical protein